MIFGATGDLARRKIFPALYNLERMGVMPPDAAVIGFARRDLERGGVSSAIGARVLRAVLALAAPRRGGLGGLLPAPLLPPRLLRRRGGLSLPRLAPRGPGLPANALFYLAVAPEEFAVVARRLASAGLGSTGGAPRVARERPGPSAASSSRSPSARDRASARSLNATLQDCFAEDGHLPHRPLPRQGDGAEPPVLPLRQLDLRAAVEPQPYRVRRDRRARDRAASARGAATTTRRARPGTCCRTTSSSSSASSRWSRPRASAPSPSGARR